MAAQEKQPKIIIDKREGAEFGRLLAMRGAEVEWQNLSVGDFVLSGRLVAERKTRADFEASIIDGRLFEQAKRLGEGYARAVVIIEGEEGAGRGSREAILGAYAALIADFGLAVFFTRNNERTAELVYALAKHEQCARKVKMRVRAKPKRLSVAQEQLAIVEGLPGIGPETARNLLRQFGSVAGIFSAGEKELKEADGIGKKRAKIIRAVLEKAWDAKE